MKLQYKFAGAIFGVGGVFLLAISVMYFFETREGDIHSQQLLFEKTALERAEHISLTLKEKAHIASVLSRSHVVISGLAVSNAQFAGLDDEKRRGEIKRLDEAWIHAKNEDDPFVRLYMTNAVAEFFKEHERAFPGEYGEIFLTNKYGAIIATTKKLTTLAHAHKYWWIATYNGGKGRVFFDDRGYDMSAKGYVIGVTVPVVKNGEVIGILKCNLDITATLNRIVESFRPGATGKLMIVRGKGKIVLARGVKPLSADAPSTLVAKLAGRASGSLILSEGGVQTLTAYAAITMANGEGVYGFGGTADSIDHLMGNRGELWFVVISQSLEEAIAESYERTREIALTGVILIALMGVAAMYFGRRIALPVTRMEKFAQKIGKGDYDVHVDAPPGDEMGNLAIAFNQMAVNLRTTTGSRDRLAEEVERRKEAEKALQQKANDVRALLDSAQESMFLMEVGGVVIALNETAAKRFGKTPDELVGKDMYDFMPPELAVVRRQREAEAIRNRSALTVEDERAGRFIRTTLWPVVDDKTGEVVRLAAFSIDITQRRKYEMEMQENRALLRRTLDSLMDAVFVLDAATVTVKEVNKAATDIFGYQTDELIGKTTEFLHVSPESLEAFRKELYPAIERQGYLHLSDFRMKRRDGSIFPTENSVFPLNDEQGRPVAWVSVVRDLSKVREAEERFRLLFNSGSDAIFVSLMGEEAPGRFIEVNDIACQRLGYSREELLNMSPLDIDDSSQPGYTEDVARVVDELKSGHGVIFEQVHKAKDGRLIPVEINTRRFFYGGKVASLAIVRDITERKRAEAAIRESENRFRLVADSAPVLIWMAGPDGKCSYFNKGWLDFTGRPLEDEMGDGWAQGVHPHDRARLMDLYMAALEGRRKFSIEYRLWRKDGIYRWVLDSGVPRFSPGGDFIGYIGSAIDITDRKAAEEALARSEKKIRDITAVIGQGVYALDAEGHLTFMNPEAERLLGWTEAELLGRDVHRLFHERREDGSVIKRGECPAHKALGTGQPQLADGELLTKKDGGMFPASIVATPMMEEGRVAGVVVAFSDITERQRILREITEAKERAEEATKLKDKFVSLVAHDLKSPFASIMGLLEVIKEDEAQTLDARNRDIMIHVLQSGRRLLHMIDDLLDISRLKTGKIKPEFRFFDGSVLAGMALAHISQQAAGKGVGIMNEVPAGTRLYADPNLFGEVLQNLLVNAVKFSEKGDVVTVFSPGGGIIAVKDMGVGIKKSALPFLFRHEEKTTTPGTAGELGTGLGLPLSHDMMTAMGGDLAVESEEGAGSVFYASLPHVNPVALIVDDQAPVRYLVNQHLIRIGVATVEAEDGEQALELIRRKRPHLVVTDIMMPKMSGFDLLEAIRKNPETASIPVIMITADNQVESREKSFRMGADDFVSKPIKPEDFIPRVRRFLG